jgi:hypothetical protein
MRTQAHLAAVVAGVLLCVFAAQAADVSGKWTATFDTQVGQQTYTYVLKADGEKVTGKAIWERMGQKGETELQEGKLAGDQISFVEMLDFEGNAIRIEYKGTVKGDEIAFTRRVGDFATEELVAKRAKE